MSNITKYSLKMKLYSTKAAEIIEAALDIPGWMRKESKLKAMRNQDGEVFVEAESKFRAGIEYQLDRLDSRLLEIAHRGEMVNTIKTRAADEREYNGFKMRDYSLLGYLLRNYSRKPLVANFGQEAVDEMLGKPFNPLEAARRTLIAKTIEQKRSEMKAAVEPVRDRYGKLIEEMNDSAASSNLLLTIIKLQGARKKEIDGIEKQYFDEIAKLQAELT